MADGLFSYETIKGTKFGVRLKLKDVDGSWKKKTWRGFASLKEARAFRDRQRHIRSLKAQGLYDEPLCQTINHFILHHTHKKSARDDRRFAQWWVNYYGETIGLSAVTVDSLHKARSILLRDKSNRTTNHYVAFLRHVFNVALQRGVARENPVLKLKLLPEPPSPTIFLTVKQEEALKKAMGEKWAWARFAVLTGMRSGEQFSLRWDQIDWDNKLAVLPKTKSGRVVYKLLTDEALDILKTLPRRHDRIFYVSVSRWKKLFRECRDLAGLPKTFTWHTLRHTLGSRLGMSGATAMEIGAILGHTTPAMASRYTHFGQEHLRKVLERGTK